MLLRALRGAARWYLRRGGVSRFLVFFTVFILPILVYAYMKLPGMEEVLEGAGTAGGVDERVVLGLPRIPFFSLTSGRAVFYIGDFRLYGDYVYAINGTAYIYYRDRGELALLLDLSGGDNTIFVVTAEVDATFMNLRFRHATLLLPATRAPQHIPHWALPAICRLVGGEESPYEAWREGTLPSTYRGACS